MQSSPSFSEGRRPEVIQSILDAITRSGGVYLLDVNTHPEQNRTEITFVGLPEEVQKSLFAGARVASQLIDMDEHRGNHPRLGAIDRIPIMPIRDVTLENCVHIAHQLGHRLGRILQLPVYFYEAAMMRPQYRNIEAICHEQFQYEQLIEKIHADPAWMPDVGPAQIGTAGAVCIGAMLPPVIFRVFLNTENPDILQKIATALDHDLHYVQTTASERGQITLTILNYEKTPLARVLETLRREAARYGRTIETTEIQGLIPQAVLAESAAWYLQLGNFNMDRILENRLANAEIEQVPLAKEEPPVPEDATVKITLPSLEHAPRLRDFASEVAQATITPGGGAVSTLAGVLAAALAGMVSGLTLGRKGYDDVQSNMQAIQATASVLREKLLLAVDRDVETFQQLMDALRLPISEPDREAQIQLATLNATHVPLEVARHVYEALQLLQQVAELGNHNAAFDAAVGANMARAALESAALNIRINLLGLDDQVTVKRYTEELQRLLKSAQQQCDRIVQIAAKRAGLTED